MKEERLSISPQEIDLYVAKAKQLRSQEVSRIAGLCFRLPQQLIRRVSGKANLAAELDGNSAGQSA